MDGPKLRTVGFDAIAPAPRRAEALVPRSFSNIILIQLQTPEATRVARFDTWLKLKCSERQEFVIGGFIDREGSSAEVGSLLLGVHDDSGTLRYVGKPSRYVVEVSGGEAAAHAVGPGTRAVFLGVEE